MWCARPRSSTGRRRWSPPPRRRAGAAATEPHFREQAAGGHARVLLARQAPKVRPRQDINNILQPSQEAIDREPEPRLPPPAPAAPPARALDAPAERERRRRAPAADHDAPYAHDQRGLGRGHLLPSGRRRSRSAWTRSSTCDVRPQRVIQESGFSASASISGGRPPSTRSASVTDSSTARTFVRSATHTRCSGSAVPT
jgi:hypothetical protein